MLILKEITFHSVGNRVVTLRCVGFNFGCHIFCGEPGPKKMSGLHYRGRYLQMQEQGWGGLLPPSEGKEEIVPNLIYTLGIEFDWRGRRVKDRMKGYVYSLSAEDLLAHGTRAFQQLGQKRGRGVCLYTLTDPDSNTGFQAVFVAKNGAIRSLYPDATPSSDTAVCNK